MAIRCFAGDNAPGVGLWRDEADPMSAGVNVVAVVCEDHLVAALESGQGEARRLGRPWGHDDIAPTIAPQ